MQWNCWSLMWSWSGACRCCSNYIFILGLTPKFNGLSKDNYKTRRETCSFWDLMRFISEVWWYMAQISPGTQSIFHASVPGLDRRGCCHIKYPFKTRRKFHSRQKSFAHKLFFNCRICLRFCTEYGSDTAMLYTKFRNDLGNDMNITGEHEIWILNEFRWDIIYCNNHLVLTSRCCAIYDIHPKLNLKLNLAKSRSSITSVSLVQSFWNCAQRTAVLLSCSVHNWITGK